LNITSGGKITAHDIIHRGYVFKIGGIFMEDSAQNLLESDEVKRAFLGGWKRNFLQQGLLG